MFLVKLAWGDREKKLVTPAENGLICWDLHHVFHCSYRLRLLGYVKRNEYCMGVANFFQGGFEIPSGPFLSRIRTFYIQNLDLFIQNLDLLVIFDLNKNRSTILKGSNFLKKGPFFKKSPIFFKKKYNFFQKSTFF